MQVLAEQKEWVDFKGESVALMIWRTRRRVNGLVSCVRLVNWFIPVSKQLRAGLRGLREGLWRSDTKTEGGKWVGFFS